MNNGRGKYHIRCYYTNINKDDSAVRVATQVEQKLLRRFLEAWKNAGQPLTGWKFSSKPIAETFEKKENPGQKDDEKRGDEGKNQFNNNENKVTEDKKERNDDDNNKH